MIVDVRGTNTRNKGAQLMLHAICQRLGGRFELSLPPAATDYAVRAKLGLRQTLYEPALPRLSSGLGNLVPARIRTEYGLTSGAEVGGVIDASGFLYTDQFDASVNWAAVTGIKLAANGQLTSQAGAGAAIVAYVVSLPTQEVPFLGLEFSAA